MEAQYFKRAGQSMRITHIFTGAEGAKYFVRVHEHRGWDDSLRETSIKAAFADEDQMRANVAAYIDGLLLDGYLKIE